MRARSLIPALILALLASAPAAAGEVRTDVVLVDYPFAATNAEIGRRIMTPLDHAGMEAVLARSGQGLRAEAVDLAKERYLIFTPVGPPPPGGWGLLVFIPPWSDARMPTGWAQALERQGLVFVTPAQAGNDQSPVGRREPLALAAVGLVGRMKLDPARVYIAGFSGGSRMALRLAAAYPDVFAGALLNAGSDPIGRPGLPLPPADLFERFQTTTRVAFVTGETDTVNLGLDNAARSSLRDHCVSNVRTVPMPRQGHATPDAGPFQEALKAIDRPASPDTGAARTCRAALKARADAAIAEAEALLAQGKADQARDRLAAADRRFGGLAAPRSLELAKRLPAG